MKHQAPKTSFDSAISTRPKEIAKTKVEGTITFYYYNATYKPLCVASSCET